MTREQATEAVDRIIDRSVLKCLQSYPYLSFDQQPSWKECVWGWKLCAESLERLRKRGEILASDGVGVHRRYYLKRPD